MLMNNLSNCWDYHRSMPTLYDWLGWGFCRYYFWWV